MGKLWKPPNNSSLALALRLGAFGAFAAIVIAFAIAAPGFLSIGNLLNVVQQSAILGLLAFGLTIVIIGGGGNVVTGGIDLSIAANLGLSAAIYATSIQKGYSDPIAIAACLITGSVVGAVNAIAVTKLKILPLLATLAVAKIVSGLEFVLTQNSVVTASSPFLSWLSDTGPLKVPVMAYAWIAVTIVVWPTIQATPFGLRLHAVGAHREAARAAGLPVSAYVAGTYVISGLLSALAGILSAAYLTGSSPGSADILLSVVVAALLGVVFSPRLTPTIGGALLAALFIGLLGNGFQLVNISSYWVSGVEGALILFVVACTPSNREAEP
jgi:ribose transport system permease protein